MNPQPDLEIAELERIHSLATPNETSVETLYRWAQYDLALARAEMRFLRNMALEDAIERRTLGYSRNHWRLFAALCAGFAALAMWAR